PDLYFPKASLMQFRCQSLSIKQPPT
ncbi:hypothetical protein D046_4650B, partial [Vibrio parahaemolyticus V-223/04]